METIRTIEGEVEEIKSRISSSGDTVVEMFLVTGAGKERVMAYADKADALNNLHSKMQGLVTKNGVASIKDLHVKVEISGLVKQGSSNNEVIVTGIKIVTGG
ncbi:MAG: hypothetical protein QM523_00755 [Candidatus Pacebacteria bacterium]|nr:hypothetical protein [Candidatus Paceibacterota bacterium]